MVLGGIAQALSLVDPCKLNMLHHGWDEGIFSVCYGVGFALDGILEESVNKDGSSRPYFNSFVDIRGKHLIIIDVSIPLPPRT